MAGIDQSKIFTGGPNQTKVVGAILRAPLGTTMPATIDTAPDAAFVASGYITEDGLELTPELSTKDIKDWSGAVVRKLVETFTNELMWKHLETAKESLENYFGAANVTVTARTTTKGEQIKAVLNKNELPHGAFIFQIKDGPRRIMITVADGQVAKREKLAFKATDPTTWGVTLSTFEDTNGNHVTIFTDDGVFATV